MSEEYYVKYNLCFRNLIKIEKNTVFENFRNNFIKNVIIEKSEDERITTIKLNLIENYFSNKDEKEILSEVEDFLIEFLHKLSLKLKRGLFPFYKIEEYKLDNNLNLIDYIKTFEELTIFDNLPDDFEDENINFREKIVEYKKMIRILTIADTDPVTVFLVLYDWFMDWVTPEGKNKSQKYVVEYIKNFKEELEKPKYDGFLEYIIIFNEIRNNEEDIFTKIRNDVAHSLERNADYSQFFDKCKSAIKPIVFTMTHYLKNN